MFQFNRIRIAAGDTNGAFQTDELSAIHELRARCAIRGGWDEREVADGQFKLIYRKDTNLAGIVYEVVASEDLQNPSWSSVGITEELLSTEGNIQTMEVRVPVESANRRFLRLNVQQLPP